MVSCVFGYGCFFFQAEDGIRYLVRSRGLGDVYKRQCRGTAGAPGDLRSLPGGKTWRAGHLGGRPPGASPLSLIHI